MAHFSDASVPALAPMFRFQWEAAQDCFVLLYPEGMVKLSGSAGEIIKRCDGETAVREIVNDLMQQFPDADLKQDIFNFLESAYEQGWIIAK